MEVGIPRRWIVALTSVFVAAALIGTGPASSMAAATLVGKDGRVYACYKAKGKQRGAVRLVTKKARCRHGEKKVSWSVAGPAGEAGAKGATGERGPAGEKGAPGDRGQAGESSSAPDLKTLEEKVTGLTSEVETLVPLVGKLSSLETTVASKTAEIESLVTKVTSLESLTGKVTALEGVLSGVTNGDLTGALGKLQNVTGAQLVEAVNSVADVTALCTQASALTTQVDQLGEVFGGLHLATVLAVTLQSLVPVPTALDPFSC